MAVFVFPGVGGLGVVAPWSEGVLGVRGVDGWAPPDTFCSKEMMIHININESTLQCTKVKVKKIKVE